MEKPSRQPHIQNVERISRRHLLTGLTASGALLAYGAKLGTDYHSEKTSETIEDGSEDVVNIESTESVEMIAEDLDSPVFDRVLNARIVEVENLRRDQVLFVDGFGRQLTEPFTLSKTVGLTPEEMTWRSKDGKPAGIPGAWTSKMRAYVSEKTGVPVGEIEMLHVYQDLDNDDQKQMTSKIELAYQNSTTPLEDDPDGRSAIEVLLDDCEFPNIPEPLSLYLKSALIGIACEESRFKGGKISSKGAGGILQVMADVAKKYKEKHGLENDGHDSLADQVPMAVEHIELTYRTLIRELAVELSYFTRNYFNGNSASMEKYLLLPLIINAYNIGQDRMVDVVKWYTNSYADPLDSANIFDTGEKLSGYDLYFSMIYQCAKEKGVPKIGTDSSNYVEKVMGWERAYLDYSARREEIKIASN